MHAFIMSTINLPQHHHDMMIQYPSLSVAELTLRTASATCSEKCGAVYACFVNKNIKAPHFTCTFNANYANKFELYTEKCYVVGYA